MRHVPGIAHAAHWHLTVAVGREPFEVAAGVFAGELLDSLCEG